MSFNLAVSKNPNDAKRAAIEAAKAKAAGKEATALVRYTPPGECADRIRVVFDDSVSMGEYIEDARRGVVEFLRNCIPNQTAVAVHFMNTLSWSTTLRSDLSMLGADIQEARLSSGSTPFFNILKKALKATPVLTRLVAFTDGAPTDQLSSEGDSEMQPSYSSVDTWTESADIIICIARSVGGEKCIPIDTVYFGSESRQNMDLLRYLSSNTGGYFLHFDPAKVNFATAFKYLAPTNRLLLSNSSFRAAVESGAQK